MMLAAPVKSVLSAPFSMFNKFLFSGTSCFTRAIVGRAIHGTTTTRRDPTPSRQVAQVGSNQLSLEQPRNAVGA